VPEAKLPVTLKTRVKDLDIWQVDFSNGTRLNIKKTDFKADSVIAEVGFGFGKYAEPAQKQGLANLATAVINESGFAGMKKEILRRALAGKTAHMSFAAGEGRFSLNGSCTTDEIELLFQLFYTFYKDFGCNEEAYKLSLDQLSQQYDELVHTIDGAMALKGRRFLAGGDTRFGMPPQYEFFTALTLDDIRKWVAVALRQYPPEISVVGDIDPEDVIRVAAKYFDTTDFSFDTSQKPAKKGDRAKIVFPGSEMLKLKVPTKIEKARVEVAWPTDDFWDIGQTRRFSVLSAVFSERMRKNIREDTGKSYSQFAYNRPSRTYPGYGVFHAVVNSSPDETTAVTAQIRDIAADILKNGITEEELHRASEPILTSIGEMVETNRYWLYSVLSGSQKHPEQINWSRTFLKDYESISAQDVEALAKKYLDNKQSTAVVVIPERKQGTHNN